MNDRHDPFDERLRSALRQAVADIKASQRPAPQAQPQGVADARRRREPPGSPGPRSRLVVAPTLAFAGVVGLIGAVVGTSLWAAHRGGAPSTAPAHQARWHVSWHVTVGGGPYGALTARGSSAFITSRGNTALYRVDAGSQVASLYARPETELPGGGLASTHNAVLVGPNGVWASTTNHLLLLDPAGGAVAASLDVGDVGPAHALIDDGTSIWAASGDAGTVVRIDPRNARVAATIQVVSAGAGASTGVDDPASLASLDGSIFVIETAEGRFARIDPASNRVTGTYPLPGHAAAVGGTNGIAEDGDMAAGFGSLWIASSADGMVTRIDPATGASLASIAVADPVRLAVSDAGVWVASSSDGTVVLIDPASNAVTDRLSVGTPVFGIAADGARVWAASGQAPDVSLIEPGP